MENIGELQKQYILKRTEILIYFANNQEINGFKNKLKELKINIHEVEVNDYVVNFFKYNNFHIAFFLGNSTGSQEANRVLNIVGNQFPNLKYIFNLGCCANAEDNDNKYVIFADRIFDADLRKENDTGTIYSGNENKHYKLSNKIKNGLSKIRKIEYEIKYKPLIANSALINNKECKKKIKQSFPYAAGIEMEGLAISDYALTRGIEWIVIKGTSDKGYDKKEHKNQENVSYFASDLFFKIINQEVLERNRINIFISGALHKTKKYKNFDTIQENVRLLSKKLLENNCKIINGFGYIVGENLLTSAYDYIRDNSSGDLKNYIEISPSPREINYGDKIIKQYSTLNREKMIEKSLISLFIFGKNTKTDSNNGMYDEFNISLSKNVPRIVIPQDDFYSSKLYDYLKNTEFDGIKCSRYLELIKDLPKCRRFEENINKITEMINLLDDFYYAFN